MKITAIAAAIALLAPVSAFAQPAATAESTGVVKAVDLKAGMITLQHGPITALNWPAMTMPFKIDPALLNTVKVGQKVNFTVKADGEPEVVAVKPAG